MAAETYAVGESVLVFYGPLLFKAKVQEVEEKADEPYLVHFDGWSKSQDQWVSLDQLNKNTADNRKYQKELAAAHEKATAKPVKEKKEREGEGEYKVINGVNYSRAMVEAADKGVAGEHDGVLSIEDCKKILKAVLADDKYSKVERRTMKYIRENYKFTEKADAFTRRSITAWANKARAAAAAAKKEKKNGAAPAPKKKAAPKKKVSDDHKKEIEKVQKSAAGRKKVPSLIAQSLEEIGSYYDAEGEVKASEKAFKAALRKAFRLFDANHNNMLEKDELAAMMRSMGRRPLQKKIDAIFEMLDEDGNGSIDFAEFLKYFKGHHAPLRRSKSELAAAEVDTTVKEAAVTMTKRKREEEDAVAAALESGSVDRANFPHSERLFKQQLREVFNDFDKDNNNTINKKELGEALKKMGKIGNRAKVDAIFLCCDKDNSGSIDFDEFFQFFHEHDIEDLDEPLAKRLRKSPRK